MPSMERLSRHALPTRKRCRVCAGQRPEIHPARKAASTLGRGATKGPSLDQSFENMSSCKLPGRKIKLGIVLFFCYFLEGFFYFRFCGPGLGAVLIPHRRVGAAHAKSRTTVSTFPGAGVAAGLHERRS